MKRLWDFLCAYLNNHPLLFLIICGITVRLFILLIYQQITIYPDSSGYLELGDRLLNFNLEHYEGQRSPGYPALIFFSGGNLWVTVCIQMFLGVAASVYIYKTLFYLGFISQKAALISIACTTMMHVLFFETAILTEAFTLFFIALSLYLILKYFIYQNNFKKDIILGLVLGILVINKPFYIYIPFVIYGLYILHRFSFRKIFSSKLVVFVLPLVSFLGWSAVNLHNTGYFTSTTFYGFNMAQNCVSFAEDVPDDYAAIRDIYVKHREIAVRQNKDVAMSIWFAYDELKSATQLPFPELSHKLSLYAREAIARNPGGYARQILTSWTAFWSTEIHWDYYNFALPNSNKAMAVIWLAQKIILLAAKFIFVLLMPYYIYLWFRNKKITPVLIIVCLVLATSLLQAIATYGNNSRFSFPFEYMMVAVVLYTFRRPLRLV
jgi:4-amino-4-deoxy-L-arabinose transferase-like glycosyltransferase